MSPIFDRTDIYKFRVRKVELTKDTTFVSCTYNADNHSWANISDKTYLEDVRNGERFPIVKVSGIPFGPQKKYFTDAEEVNVILYFPHVSTDKINIIENDEEEAFNIYGIDLCRSYNSSYTSEDIQQFFEVYRNYEDEKNWPAALEYTQKQLEATNYVEGIRSFASACSMYNMIMVYLHLEEYGKVIEFGKKNIALLRELPKDSIYLDVLARTYGNVATAYHLLNEHDTGNDYMELSLATRRLKDGVGTLNYEEFLREMAKNYYYEENYPKALLYGKEIVDIYENKYCKNPYKYERVYINALNNLCEFYLKMGKTNEAVSTGKRAMELIDEGGCDDYDWLKYAIYHNLGIAFLSNWQIDEGIDFLEVASKEGNYKHGTLNSRLALASAYLYYKQDTIRALNEYEAIQKTLEDSMSIEKDNSTYLSVLYKLYEIHRLNNPDVAMQYLNKDIELYKKWHGKNSIAYANILLKKVENIWASCLTGGKDVDSLLLLTCQAAGIIKRHIINSSQNMSKNDRKAYWLHYEDFFTRFIPTISGLLNIGLGNSMAYDAALFYKGMLLSTERELKNLIQNSCDDELIRLYQDYTYHLTELEKQYYINSAMNTVDSLKSLIHNEDFLLSQRVTQLNQRYKGTDFSWKEVRGQLGKDDIAIEIVSYPGIDGQNTYYDAYVIGYNYIAPQLIRLCNEEKLKSLSNDSIDYEGLSTLFWGNEKLYGAIKDAKNIYFSTSGMLNTIGIEYLPIGGNQYICDRFNLYRLSSTRELCLRNDTTVYNQVCLYGGLDYDYKTPQPKDKKTIPDRLSRSAVESLSQRGGFDYLNGSMEEVEQIKSVISRRGINCVIFSKSEGTEESLKRLSGSHTGILHLSTHGMYIPDNNEATTKINNFNFVLFDETQNVNKEDMSLTRSFLVLAGGNALIRRDSISKYSEDGIMTALEISHIDLANLDLVVLSACETALGKIESEGVYGLQRGFKKAGANTILMSLNKIDDEATKILMVEFYRNLMSGKTKRQSLYEAQQYLRKVDNGKYDDPEYWASFIMLDGLN